MRSPFATTAALGLLAAAFTTWVTTAPASAGRPHAAAPDTSVRVHSGGPDKTIRFHRGRPGEVFLDVTVSARGVSWADRGNASAVVSAFVDGHYATDIVVTSATPVTREFALGHLAAGRHTLRLHYATGRSPSDAGVARLQDIGFKTVRRSSPAYAAARFAPVLYGRNVSGPGGPFQNNRTDTPLIAWHEVLPVAGKPHRHLLEYSVVWSNEDGGTPAPALMAQWGRTTDIEWIYRVEIDAQGHRVPSTGVFQSPLHGTTTFKGAYDGTHPLLQTCTLNNNVCDKVTLRQQTPHQAPDPMRFALSTRDTRSATQPREHLMDLHPWTYQVMGREMVREGKVTDPVPDPSIPALADQRTYLYLALNQTPGDANVGLAVDVVLKADPTTTYTSDHGQLGTLFAIHRSGPAATTVKLPPGTTAADIQSISVRRVTPLIINGPVSTASVDVTALDRAFFLASTYLPEPSFATLPLDVTVTAAAPTAVIWSAP